MGLLDRLAKGLAEADREYAAAHPDAPAELRTHDEYVDLLRVSPKSEAIKRIRENIVPGRCLDLDYADLEPAIISHDGVTLAGTLAKLWRVVSAEVDPQGEPHGLTVCALPQDDQGDANTGDHDHISFGEDDLRSLPGESLMEIERLVFEVLDVLRMLVAEHQYEPSS